MARSYLYYSHKNNSDKKCNIDDITRTDAIIIDLEEYELSNELLIEAKDKNKDVYLLINSNNKKINYRYLNTIDFNYITGLFIKHATCKDLNRYTIKARELESSKRLNYGTIVFIPIIDNPKSLKQMEKIGKYDRVKAISLDLEGFKDFLNVQKDSIKLEIIRNEFILKNEMNKCEIIDGDFYNEDVTQSKKFGFYGKCTNDVSQISIINDVFTPSQNEIDKSLYILDGYERTNPKKKRYFEIDGKEYSINTLVDCNLIYNQALELNLIDEKKYNYVLKSERLKEKNPISLKKFYSMGEEIANAITHGIGAMLSIVAIILLILKAVNNDSEDLIAYLVFAISSFILYLTSTLYHALPIGKAKSLFQKLDHMNIYILIAGTYTPMSLLVLDGKLGIYLCAYLWIGAMVGFLLNLFWFGKFKIFHMIMYVALGWTGALFFGKIYDVIGTVGMIFLIGGGIMYTLGVVFYSMKLFKYTHMIWHIFCLFGTILHFFCIFLTL